MTTNDYMALHKRNQIMTNGLMLLLGASLTIIVSLLFFMNQNPASAKADTAANEDGSYALYAAAYSQGMAAAQSNGASVSQSSTCAEPTTDAAASAGGYGAMMSPEEWKAAVYHSYNTYTNTAEYTSFTDNSNTAITNNTSSSTVNVTNSDGATVSSNSATNGQVNSSTGAVNLGSNNTSGSFNQETTNTNVTTNTDADITTDIDTTVVTDDDTITTLINDSFKDESIRSVVDLSLIDATVRS